MLEGALILLAGILIGRFAPARRRKPKPVKDPKPICGCGHHRSFHEDGGACKERVYLGIAEGHKPCTCRHYVGPEVYPTFVAEIGG